MADDQETRITLRLPPKLHGALVISAEKNARSMNGEIVFRLEEFAKMIQEMGLAENRASKLETDLLHQRRERASAEFNYRQAKNEVVALQEQLHTVQKQLQGSMIGEKTLAEVLDRLTKIDQKLGTDKPARR